ncbi:unnamed protein product [Rangifer tarandus platyrhynchus]|uniref:Uncharacterized protein n=2 Tax=Rangifer tarandus platyrhynchus TaxID=3082113 RepID=A0ACB0DZI7_RANTA|nr:unnamed protein product [Rangifer tarandus platyrhynchus]CAI9693695.1 unnamed protein product [Rangifer tarandus platyrhynchus]
MAAPTGRVHSQETESFCLEPGASVSPLCLQRSMNYKPRNARHRRPPAPGMDVLEKRTCSEWPGGHRVRSGKRALQMHARAPPAPNITLAAPRRGIGSRKASGALCPRGWLRWEELARGLQSVVGDGPDSRFGTCRIPLGPEPELRAASPEWVLGSLEPRTGPLPRAGRTQGGPGLFALQSLVSWDPHVYRTARRSSWSAQGPQRWRGDSAERLRSSLRVSGRVARGEILPRDAENPDPRRWSPTSWVDEGLCAACMVHGLPRPFFSHEGPWLPAAEPGGRSALERCRWALRGLGAGPACQPLRDEETQDLSFVPKSAMMGGRCTWARLLRALSKQHPLLHRQPPGQALLLCTWASGAEPVTCAGPAEEGWTTRLDQGHRRSARPRVCREPARAGHGLPFSCGLSFVVGAGTAEQAE